MYSISYKKGITLIRENYKSHAFAYTTVYIHLHQVTFQYIHATGYATGWISECKSPRQMPSYPTPIKIFKTKGDDPNTKEYSLIYKDKKFLINIKNEWCEVIGGKHLIIKGKEVYLYCPIFK